MPGIFTFRIPSYFNFNFRAGPNVPSLKDQTLDIESSPNGNADFEAINEAETLVPLPSHSTKNLESSPCGTLNKFPLELRVMVYMNVLRSEKNIKQAHRFLGPHPPIMADDAIYIEAIDAALLRTCRAIYREGILVLYGKNRFHFRRPNDIKEFAHLGLRNKPFGFHGIASRPQSALCDAPRGRLTMIRFLSLRMSSENNQGLDRKNLWSQWCDFFYPSEEQEKLVGFPALERLVLDFTDWGLQVGDPYKVRVRPNFLNYMRPLASIRCVSTLGLSPWVVDCSW